MFIHTCFWTLVLKLHNVLLYSRPPINFLQITVPLCHSWINGISRTMRFCQHFLNQVIYSSNKYPLFNIEHTILIKSGLLCLTNYGFIYKIIKIFILKYLGVISSVYVSLTSMIANTLPFSKMPNCLNLNSNV